jgi:hypothetical protein
MGRWMLPGYCWLTSRNASGIEHQVLQADGKRQLPGHSGAWVLACCPELDLLKVETGTDWLEHIPFTKVASPDHEEDALMIGGFVASPINMVSVFILIV